MREFFFTYMVEYHALTWTEYARIFYYCDFWCTLFFPPNTTILYLMISCKGELRNGTIYAKLPYLLPISGKSGVQKRMSYQDIMHTKNPDFCVQTSVPNSGENFQIARFCQAMSTNSYVASPKRRDHLLSESQRHRIKKNVNPPPSPSIIAALVACNSCHLRHHCRHRCIGHSRRCCRHHCHCCHRYHCCVATAVAVAITITATAVLFAAASS